MSRLENWSMGPASHGDGYAAPETIVYVLEGNVYRHPQHPDGQLIHTGEVIGELDLVNRTAQTRIEDGFKTYELGKPNPNYLQFLLDNEYPSGQVLKDW